MPSSTMQSSYADSYGAPTAARAGNTIGIGRLTYFFFAFLVGLAFQFGMLVLSERYAGEPPPEYVLGSLGLFALTVLYITGERLANMGSSRWWSIVSLVPVFNIFIGFQCIVCQAGYCQTRKLDGAGTALKWLFGLTFGLMFAGIVAIMAIGANAR